MPNVTHHSVFSVEPVASKFRTQVFDGMACMEQHDCSESRTLFEIHAERSTKPFTLFVKTLSQQKYIARQSTAPLQLKCFKVVSRIAIAASAPVLPN
jgi:hypothetical protein